MKFKRMSFFAAVLIMIFFFTAGSHAEVTFRSTKNLAVDAQNIRLKALSMGWEVNKPLSFIAAAVILGKDLIYPRADVEIALRESGGQLQIRAQVSSQDAGTANWHNIHAEKKKKNSSPSKTI